MEVFQEGKKKKNKTASYVADSSDLITELLGDLYRNSFSGLVGMKACLELG